MFYKLAFICLAILAQGVQTCSVVGNPIYDSNCQNSPVKNVACSSGCGTVVSGLGNVCCTADCCSVPSPPTIKPTIKPQANPTRLPTGKPQANPTQTPTLKPISSTPLPTRVPSRTPSRIPTQLPISPTIVPTRLPSRIPTPLPILPTAPPTFAVPTAIPSPVPTQPTFAPSPLPSQPPSATPTSAPTAIDCRPGFYRLSDVICGACQPGFISLGGSATSCTPCDPGTFNPFRNASACTPCDGGAYNPFDNVTECISCSSGGYSPAGSPGCSVCPAGFYCPDNALSAGVACPISTYQDGQGAINCKKCPSGFLTTGTGSTTANACYSPVPNFLFGSLTLLVSFYVVWRYLICGRFRKVAFLRYQRLLNESVDTWKLVYEKAKDATVACQIMARDASKQEMTKSNSFSLRGLVFALFGLLLIPCVVFVLYISAIISLLFSSLIIWRGLNPNIRIPFAQAVYEFFGQFKHIFEIILVPITYLFILLSNIKIDLTAINVTCAGSQAPIELFLNLIILGVTILVVESELFVFWYTTFTTANRFLLLTTFADWKIRNQFGWTFFRFVRNVVYTVWAYTFAELNVTYRTFQYIVGFATIQQFVGSNGAHAYSDACTAFDAVLAYFSTILGYFALIISFFIVAQVFVPGKVTVLSAFIKSAD